MNSLPTSPPKSTAGGNHLGLPDIAFVGKAGAGKSTAAQLLVELDLGYHVVSFATPLKGVACEIWGQDAMSDRDKLQRLGVAVREIDDNAWVNKLIDYTQRYRDNDIIPDGQFAVDDCRFENEWYALKAENFVIVRVIAERNQRSDRLKANGKWQSEGQLEHRSETAVDHLTPDYTIANSADKDCLYDRLVDIVIKERKRR